MPEINVVWLNYETGVISRGFWDQGMIEDIVNNRMWRTGFTFKHTETDTIPDDIDGAIIVFPARNQIDYIEKLNEQIAKLSWVILMLTGDEESNFPIEDVKHDNIKIWVMSPQVGRHDNYDKLGTGYPTHMHKYMPTHAPEKNLDWYFAGQVVNNPRREKAAAIMKEMKKNSDITGIKGEYLFSPGFTQGVTADEYYKNLARAKVAPAPSGPETPDSFRLFEALEAGCMPIADTRTHKDNSPDDYWTKFFGVVPPFPVITDWEWLQGWTQDQLNVYPEKHNKVFLWWLDYKRNMALRVKQQIMELSGQQPLPARDEQITILMPSSAVDMHPSTDHIEQNIRDTRSQLPNSEIIILLDGVRSEREERRADYEEYQRRLFWLINYKWDNVRAVRFEKFGHQSTMVRHILPEVKTPFILFVEHDAPLVPDFPIEWEQLCQVIENGTANAIRLHHESGIHPEHRHLYLGGVEEVKGIRLIKTAQWSQRPHLASTAFYRYIIENFFKEDDRAFIEHGLYGPIVEAYNREGILGWNLWKLWLYHPDTANNIQRSYDLNSRGEGPNFDSEFVQR